MASVKTDTFASITHDADGTLPSAAFVTKHDALTRLAETLRHARLDLESAGRHYARLAPTLGALRRTEAYLRRPLRLALMGEFNSGKSTLANMIIGNMSLPARQLSNTRIPTLIHYSPQPILAVALRDGGTQLLTPDMVKEPPGTIRIHLGMPIPHLRACEIVDFPGFSDPWLSYGILDIASHPVDAAIWCTFSTQAWKESESTAWRLLPARIRAHSMLVVTSKDLLADDQIPKVMGRLSKVASGDFTDFTLLSSILGRRALDPAGDVRDAHLWRTSGGEEFYGRIQGLLSTIRQQRLEKAEELTARIAGSALTRF